MCLDSRGQGGYIYCINPPPEEAIMTATITTRELADALDTDARTLRKFLRANEQGVGKGARYALPANARSIAAMKKKFTKWAEGVEAAKAAKTTESDITPDED
jgi:phage antirepressor YoqD-like protein